MPFADRDLQVWAVRRRQHLRLLYGLWRHCRARWYGVRQVARWDEIDINACLCLTTLLRQNWSPALIRQLLGRPDYAVLDLQGIRPPLLLYSRDRVAQAVSGSRFRQHLASLSGRSAKAGSRLRRWSVQYQLEAASASNENAQLSGGHQDAQGEVARPPVRVASP
jgi:hypothetical protein